MEAMENLFLLDRDGTELGTVRALRTDGQMLGTFVPGPAFARHAALFARYEEAAERQLLHEIDRLGHEIDQLGLTVAAPGGASHKVEDLQVMRAGISFRWARTG